MTLRLLVAHSPAELAAAQDVEARVFLQAFGNTPEVMEQEYGPYRDRSRFVVVLDEATGSALGAARLILPSATTAVKTLVDVAADPWYLDVPDSLRAAELTGRPVWDVASLAVDRRYRSGGAGTEVTLALCHGLYRFSRIGGAAALVTVLDDRVLRLLRSMGLPWTPLPGASSRYYLGSPASTPCVCPVPALADGARAQRPDLAPALVDGVFRSIAMDPADLLPHRGGAVPETALPDGALPDTALPDTALPDTAQPESAVPVPGPETPVAGRPRRPAVPRRDTSGWRPPTDRRPDVLAGVPTSSADPGSR